MRERRRIKVEGIVQGVGFRPFVYGLAHRHDLVGSVRNDAGGVTIDVEGGSDAVASFLETLRSEAPPLAMIERVTAESAPLNGATDFVIAPSRDDAARQVLVSPDVATCDDCLRELFDPDDRRYRYPFINCTNCGPRFTIIRDVPYDRHQTTMADFPMCDDCRTEYEDPLDRRFHAQPNACPACGPQLAFHGRRKTKDERHKPQSARAAGENEDAIDLAIEALRAGAIVAVKGLGGYHLACDATAGAAVTRLRARKRRKHKPFALMARDIETIRALCVVSKAEEALLTSRQRPIVLLRSRKLSDIADAVAPGHRYLGFMLPYTPLHHLLLANGPPALVMTSGNVNDEPITYRDDEVFERLDGIADAVLTHDRDIHVRCDDSVVRCVECSTVKEFERFNVCIRRSRGYAPQPIPLPFECLEPILAVGAHLKNTFCLGKGRQAFVSQHVGDLENLETLTSFREGIDHFQRLFDLQPAVIAHDLHPEYLATKYALDWVERARQAGADVEAVGVQHHHAHVASVLAEHDLDGPVIGVAFDGTGYGTDGHIWGGEFLVVDCLEFTRAAHLAEIPLPGGEAAIRQPWRVAGATLYDRYGDDFLDLDVPFVRRLDDRPWSVLQQMIDRQVNSPPASSMGRLFDVVAALLGVRDEVTYEGQAAIELEMLADETVTGAYAIEIRGAQPYVVDTGPIVAGVVADLQRGMTAEIIAARFHNTVAAMIVKMCRILRDDTGLNQVALSGGVFQNVLLLTRALPRLHAAGFETYVNVNVPANDGGISFGQAVVASQVVK